jgi:dienelactone hydrolase
MAATVISNKWCLVRTVVLWLAGTTGAAAQDGERVATQWLTALSTGRWADAAAMVSEAVPPDRMGATQLERIWAQIEAGAGKLRGTRLDRVLQQDTMRIVQLRGEFERQELLLRVVLAPSDKIVGFNVAPAPAPLRTPPYADTTQLREEPITVGSDPWQLPGTLTLPTAQGKHPVIVLVHGSGPHDRDETLGPNRPFRDLALGLAARGIAVLRYDKRSLVHGPRMGRAITVEQEVIEDAVAALRAARAHPAIDPALIYLLGHSLGGQLAPEIATRDTALAGVILLAAPARPISELMAEQVTFLGSLPQNAGEVAQAQLRSAQETLRRYREGALPDTATVFGASVAYLRDLDARDAVTAAQRLRVPLLILQGERDYQVTMVDFVRWRTAFTGRPTVTVRSFPTLNHLFLAGSGPPNPAEYSAAGHVAQEVIEAIATWVRR